MTERAEEAAANRLKELEKPWEPADLDRGLELLQRRIRRRRAVRASVGVMAAAGLLLVLLFGVRTNRPKGGTQEIQPLASTTLGDGSTIRPAEGARVVVAEVSAQTVRVELAAGLAAFQVAKRPERAFVVESGAVRIVVVGTRFSVARVGERTRVRVEEGHVRVAWGENFRVERDLYAGGEGTYPDEAPVEEPTIAPPSVERPAESSAPPRSPRKRDAAREWRHLAQEGGYREAYALILAEGPTSVHDNVDDLLLAADAARLSGHPARALPYLDRVLERHAHDDRAPMAAFTRGRILLTLGQPGEAGESFDRAMTLGAQGSLHENALARAVEAYSRAGNTARAAKLAQSYAERYPEGRWRAAVRAHGGIDE